MEEILKYDIAVIGSGPAGYPAAIRAAQKGKKVALIECGLIGGTCLNRGCIPSKALIQCAEVFALCREAKNFGIDAGSLSFDYKAMVARKDQIVAKIRKSLEGLILANGVHIIRGMATFLSKNQIQITGQKTIEADQIIIASGSEPKNISSFPFDGEKILDSTALLEMTTLPKKMAIVGGGVIGCEFASLFQLLGVEIAIVEMLPRILPMESLSMSSTLTRVFHKRGIQLETGTKVERVEKTEGKVILHLDSKKTLEADVALIAIGREMNLDRLGLDKAGVELASPSQIAVDEHMETNVKGIYAVGDIASKWWLAHVGTHQGLVAADNACGIPTQMHYEAIPNVIFTHPEIASVGISLEEAKKQEFAAKSAQFPFKALGKSEASGDTEGFCEIIIDEKTGRILGAEVIGNQASTLIAEMALAIQNELTIECIYETIHAHPTLSECWMEAALIAADIPLHFPKRASK